MSKIMIVGVCLLLAACANADGSLPRLGAAASGATGPASFDGGYAGTVGGLGNLTSRSTAL